MLKIVIFLDFMRKHLFISPASCFYTNFVHMLVQYIIFTYLLMEHILVNICFSFTSFLYR